MRCVEFDKYQDLYMAKIIVLNTDLTIVQYNEEDYISQADMARSRMLEHIIFRWLSLKSNIREHVSINEFIFLSDMDNLNTVFI